jgi:hypothetical protein
MIFQELGTDENLYKEGRTELIVFELPLSPIIGIMKKTNEAVHFEK